MTQPPPQVAIIIPTRNRKDLLRKVIASALAQTVSVEIFVMDDASSDATAEMMRTEFASINYRRSEVSIGPSAQRNRAAAEARAPYLITLDDDCVLASAQTAAQTIALFSHARIAAVTIPFVNVLQDKVVRTAAPGGDRIWCIYDYYGGMVAFRRATFIALGGYHEYIFMQGEEPDLATRMMGAGYVVRAGTADPIDHFESPVRDNPRRNVLVARNQILYAWYNVPLINLPVQLAGTTVLALKDGVRKKDFLNAVRGLCRGYAGMFHELARRKPLSRKVYRMVRSLKSGGPAPLEDIEPMLPAIVEGDA